MEWSVNNSTPESCLFFFSFFPHQMDWSVSDNFQVFYSRVFLMLLVFLFHIRWSGKSYIIFIFLIQNLFYASVLFFPNQMEWSVNDSTPVSCLFFFLFFHIRWSGQSRSSSYFLLQILTYAFRLFST